MFLDKEEKEIEKKIYQSLLHPQYEWRTIAGISKQTHLDEEKVKKGLERLIKKKEVRISYVPDIEGEDFFGLISRVDRAIKQY
jgi:hypothetical protein